MAKGTILRTLKPAHNKKHSFIGFDIETIGKNNDFYMGGLTMPNGEYKSFYDKLQMAKFLIKNNRKMRSSQVVATNLGFDFYGLYGNTKYWNDFKIIMKQGRLLTARYQDGNRHQNLKFIDTLNYAPFNLKTLGQIIKLPKLEAPKSLTDSQYAREPKNEKELLELEAYNKRDCEISQKFMDFLQDKLHLLGGKTKLTIASSSMDLYRRKYLKKWIYKEDHILKREAKNSLNKFIFESYSGGRTEVFKRGKIKGYLNVYDINSMYPHAMLNRYPHPSSVFIEKHPTSKVLEYEGCSLVTLATSNDYYPFLFKKKKKETITEKLLFPNSKQMRGVYTHLELRKALELGYTIKKFHYSVCYERTFRPFKEFIETLYDLRLKYKKERNPMETVVKLILNSSYGKYGEHKAQDSKIICPLGIEEKEFKELIGKLDFTKSGHIISTKEKQVYKPHQIPILASYVTGYSRINLYNYLSKYKAYYCDTDSIFTKRSLPESNKLGGMKLEYKAKNAILVKPKMYMLDIVGGQTKIRLKGVSKPNKEKFNKVLEGKDISFMKFTKIKEGLRRNIPVNSIQEVTKKVDLEDTKRRWYEKFNLQEQDSEALLWS